MLVLLLCLGPLICLPTSLLLTLLGKIILSGLALSLISLRRLGNVGVGSVSVCVLVAKKKDRKELLRICLVECYLIK